MHTLAPAGVAASLQWPLWEPLRPYVFVLMHPAEFFSSWLGGRSAGVVATSAAVAVVWALFLTAELHDEVAQGKHVAAMALFIAIRLIFGCLWTGCAPPRSAHTGRKRTRSPAGIGW